jgi:sulfonate transport system substrate-binding protein
MSHRTSALLRIAASLAAAFALASPAQAQTPPTVRFGISNAGVGNPPRVGTGWLSVAQSRHVVEDELKADGIRVEWIFFRGQGPAVNEAMTNDQLDFTTLGDLPSIIGRSVGLKARVIMVASRGSNTYVAVPPHSTARSVADLKGKRIAFHKGTATQLAADRLLERNGLAEHDVKAVNLEPASARAAFQSGDLDAIVGTLELLQMQSRGEARVIYTSRESPTSTSAGHILVTDRFAQAQPQLTQRVVTALVRAAQYASDDAHRAEVVKLWASSGTASVADYESDLAGLPLSHRLSPRFDPFVVAIDKQSVEDAYRFKLIRRKFDVDAWIDERYVETAVKQLKLENFWPRFDARGRTASP